MSSVAAIYKWVANFETGTGDVLCPKGSSRSLLRGEGREDRLDDLWPDRPFQSRWKIHRLSKIWRPLKVVGRINQDDDAQWLMYFPVFNDRSVSHLKDLIKGNVELLPIDSPIGQLHLANVTRVEDIVDLKASTLSDPDDEDSVIKEFVRYVMQPRKLKEVRPIFRLREDVSGTFVTQAFVDRVTKAGLRNYAFEKIWPWPRGTDWMRENNKLRLAARAERKRRGERDPKSESLVIRLAYKGKRSAIERKVDSVLDSLDRLLMPPKRPNRFAGKLEGHEFVSGKCLIFLSCPDTEKLFGTIQPWLRSLKWPGVISVFKRYGGFRDPTAKHCEVNPPW